MAKTSPLTGTGKKARKAGYKAQGEQAKYYKKQIPGEYKARKVGQAGVKEISKGKYIPEYGAETQYDQKSLGQLQKDYAQAGQGLEPLFAQRQKAALSNFYSNVLPGVNTALGSGSKSSSALNQAIAAARGNLAQNLNANFEEMRNQVAGGLLGQRESQRQFGAQFNQGQEQNVYNSQLQALQARLNSNQLLMGNPVNTNFSPLQNSYNPSVDKGPGMGARIVGGFARGLGGEGGGGLTNAIGSAFTKQPGPSQNIPVGGSGFGGAQPGFFAAMA